MKKIVWLPYDFDTAIGINNEGSLVFSYNLEDIDTSEGGDNIFNGQDSVVWVNLRQAFYNELQAMYQSLRSTGALSYDKVEQMFEEHQGKWPEAIFNEDANFKYLLPLINDGNGAYLSMLQGSKAEQRKWWLYNRFRYMDSKYVAGDARTDVITLRGYAVADITVTPYADIYASARYGANSAPVQRRATRGQSYTLPCSLDHLDDTEIYIYSASQLASVGDLSPLMVGYADFSNGTRLQSLKLGDSSSSYENTRMYTLTLGNNVLLRVIDVRNCSGLGNTSIQGHVQTNVDISGCSNIEHVYFDGTNILGVSLPNGGILKTLHLPSTITSLVIQNQLAITDLTIPSYANLTTLRLENVSSVVNSKSILMGLNDNSRVRLVGFYWEADDADEISDIMDKLDSMRGLDENGNNTDQAQVSGTIHTSSLTGDDLDDFNSRYPYVTVTADHMSTYLRYYNYDGSELLYTETIIDGADGGTYTGQPSRASTAANTFTFAGWSKNKNQTQADADALTAVTENRNVYAAYTITGRTYTVTFYNDNRSTVLQTSTDVPYGGTATYTQSTPVSMNGGSDVFEFIGWSPEPTNIQGDTSCYAVYRDKRSVVTKYLAKTLTSYSGTSTTKIASYGFYQMSALTEVTTPVTTIEGNAFNGCSNLTKVDLTSTSAVTIQASTFANLAKLDALIIRSTTMSTIADTSGLSGTAIAVGNGAVYVPSALVATYKADSVWKNYFIASIDDYPVTDFSTITDSWSEIFAAEANGTYSTKYSIGDTKAITVNGVNTYAQIVAMDTDELADGSGSAKITWITKGLIGTHNMNDSAVTTDGWAGTGMRTWLRETVLPTMDSTIRSNIKTVKKTYKDYNDSATETIEDTVWIPSYREIFGGTSYETSGVIYSDVFKDSTSRIKYNSSGSAYNWWLRSAYSATNFARVDYSGSNTSSGASFSNGAALGFCT